MKTRDTIAIALVIFAFACMGVGGIFMAGYTLGRDSGEPARSYSHEDLNELVLETEPVEIAGTDGDGASIYLLPTSEDAKRVERLRERYGWCVGERTQLKKQVRDLERRIWRMGNPPTPTPHSRQDCYDIQAEGKLIACPPP